MDTQNTEFEVDDRMKPLTLLNQEQLLERTEQNIKAEVQLKKIKSISKVGDLMAEASRIEARVPMSKMVSVSTMHQQSKEGFNAVLPSTGKISKRESAKASSNNSAKRLKPFNS